MLKPLQSLIGGLFALPLMTWVALAAPSPPADQAGMTTCQDGEPGAAIAACTDLIDEPAVAGVQKAKAYAARGQALTKRAFDEDSASGQDWNDCLSADPQPALAACTRIIDNPTEHDGRRADALYNRSKLLLQKGLNKEAMDDFQRSLKSFTDRQPGSRQKAVLDYTSALNLEPANSRWLAARGQIYLSIDLVELASSDFDKALTLNAKEGMALLGRALLRETKGDPVGALGDLKSIVALPTETDEAKWLNNVATQIMSRLGAD